MELTALKGIGEKTAKLFDKLHIRTTDELLTYYPRDYEYFGEPAVLSQAAVDEVVAVSGQISTSIAARHVSGLNITSFEVACAGGGTLHMTYFNMPYLKNSLKRERRYIFRGYLQQKGSRLVMEQAKIYKPEEYEKMVGHLMPRYATTKGLSSNAITKAVSQALAAQPFLKNLVFP